MRRERGRFTWLGAAVLGVLALGAVGLCTVRNRTTGDTLAKIRTTGVVRIGIANEAPYGYLDTERGVATGEAPELARLVFKRMGITSVEVVNTDFGSLIPGLKAGRFDVIAAGMYITPARCKQIAFSDPTYRIGEAFIVARGNPHGLHSFGDIVRTRTRLGVVGGAVELGYAKELHIPEVQLVIYNDNVSALEGVRTGRSDAFACTLLTAQDLLRKSAVGLEIAAPFEQPIIGGKEVFGYGAFGFRRAGPLLHAFNHQLHQLIGTDEHLALVRPFGFGALTLPAGKTAAELCASDD
ncbi:MAG: ectoine/hydroxyectoine ABC transporter substrate-binding protein EhuB [Kofleriaceae bacterium]